MPSIVGLTHARALTRSPAASKAALVFSRFSRVLASDVRSGWERMIIRSTPLASMAAIISAGFTSPATCT